MKIGSLMLQALPTSALLGLTHDRRISMLRAPCAAPWRLFGADNHHA
jgi:hypothetical protein